MLKIMGSGTTMLIGKFTAFSIYIRKEAKSQINHLHYPFKENSRNRAK